MNNNYEINDFTLDSFVHGTIERFSYDINSKIFQVVFSYLNLKHGGCLYECTITITDWLDFEVFEYNSQQYMKQFNLNEIPEIEQIFQFLFEDNELTLICMGLHRDTSIKYKFTNPQINITGEYEPD